MRNYNYYSAPPLVGGYGGYGYGGYGYSGGGLSIFPATPIFFGGGGLFNILILMVRQSILLNQCFANCTRKLGHQNMLMSGREVTIAVLRVSIC